MVFEFLFTFNFEGTLDWVEKTSAVIDLGKVVAHAPTVVSTFVVAKTVHKVVKSHVKTRRSRKAKGRNHRHHQVKDRGHKPRSSSLLRAFT